MQIDVEHVAKLARLGLTEEEKALFARQLTAILDYADNLKKLDTGAVAPTAHAVARQNVYRADKAVPCADVESILANAPDEVDHMFRVPRIIE